MAQRKYLFRYTWFQWKQQKRWPDKIDIVIQTENSEHEHESRQATHRKNTTGRCWFIKTTVALWLTWFAWIKLREHGHGHGHGLFIWMIKINGSPASNLVQDDHGCLQSSTTWHCTTSSRSPTTCKNVSKGVLSDSTVTAVCVCDFVCMSTSVCMCVCMYY